MPKTQTHSKHLTTTPSRCNKTCFRRVGTLTETSHFTASKQSRRVGEMTVSVALRWLLLLWCQKFMCTNNMKNNLSYLIRNRRVYCTPQSDTIINMLINHCMQVKSGHVVLSPDTELRIVELSPLLMSSNTNAKTLSVCVDAAHYKPSPPLYVTAVCLKYFRSVRL